MRLQKVLQSALSVPTAILVVWLCIFAWNALAPLTDPDTPWHLATGAYILAHHHIPHHDPFSWSMRGHPWITQEWFFEVVLAWLAAKLGFLGVWCLIVVVEIVTSLLVFQLAMWASKRNTVVAALVTVLASLVPWSFWVLRPQIFSYALFAAFLLILEMVRRDRWKALFFVPPLMLLWANSHASVSLGPLMLFFELILSFAPPIGKFQPLRFSTANRWRILITGLVGAGIGFINPNTWHEYAYALLGENHLMVQSIVEWHSPNFHWHMYKYGVLPFVLVLFFLVVGRKRSVSLKYFIYVCVTFALTLIYQRFLPYMTIAAAPLLAEAMTGFGRYFIRSRWYTRTLSGLASVVALVFLAQAMPASRGPVSEHFSTGAFPAGAVQYLHRHHVTTSLLNAYDWGGYLIYNHIPTFVDGRTDIFLENDTFANYMQLQNLDSEAPALLDDYDFRYILMPPSYPLSVFLLHDPHYRVVYQGNISDIFERISPSV